MTALNVPYSLCETDESWSDPAPNLDLKYADDPGVFKIPDANLDGLKHRIAWLNNRARKLDADPIVYKELEGTVVRDHKKGTVTHYTFVRVVGAPIKLAGGWTFSATLEHTEVGNIIRAVPGAEIPVSYRNADPACDHCQLDRNRKDTYIVTNDANQFMQVGRTCLKDFVGHRDPARIAAWMEWIAELANYIDEEFMRGNAGPTGVGADMFLGLTAASIRLWGWTSSTKARETGTGSTKSNVLYWFDEIGKGRAPSPDYAMHDKNGVAEYTGTGTPVATEPKDFALGRAALLWARNQSDEDMGTSGYLYNLKIVAQLDSFLFKHTGLAASLVKAYQKHIGDELARANAPVSQYVGEIKKRQLWTVLCTDIFDWESQYGVTHLHKFVDAEGNVIVWRTGSHRLDIGSSYSGKATVKAHDEYKDIKQTVITRFSWNLDDTPAAGNGE